MPNAGDRDTAHRVPVSAYVVMLGWHGLVIVAYFLLLDRQSHTRVNYDHSPWEEMWIFGVTVGAPVLLGTLLTGVILLRRLLARSRINGIVLGTAAASPMLLFVAVAAGPFLR
ncbi:hypothetical protein AB0D32_26700 [Micromonospora sp. NPDC048170]|uniref:hypothetical protein n=1 Tax=Micromonospora sp. NPDC048170 TaxID=3154819 RepID=UPI0033C0C0E7